METLDIPIGKIFDLTIRTNHSKFTKSFVQKNKGDIPVYSASKDPSLISYGYVKDNLNGVKYFENCLTWNIDGSIGRAFYRRGRFSLSEKVIPLILRKEWKGKIDYDFVRYELEKEALKFGFSFSNKAGKSKIEIIEIHLPYKNVDGEKFPDIDKQREIAERYKGIDNVKAQLSDMQLEIEEMNIAVFDDEIGENKVISLSNESVFCIDNGARVTKKEIQEAKGDIPFYSSSKFENQMMGKVSDKIKNIVRDARSFDGINLTVNADGSVGAVFLRKGKFYANDVCNVISLRDKKINPLFLKFELRTEIYKLGLNWNNKLYKQRLKEIEVKIPVKDKEEFDFEKQTVLAKKYQQVEEIKEKLINDIKEICQAKVEL